MVHPSQQAHSKQHNFAVETKTHVFPHLKLTKIIALCFIFIYLIYEISYISTNYSTYFIVLFIYWEVGDDCDSTNSIESLSLGLFSRSPAKLSFVVSILQFYIFQFPSFSDWIWIWTRMMILTMMIVIMRIMTLKHMEMDYVKVLCQSQISWK